MAGAGFREGVLLKRILEKHSFSFQSPQAAGKSGAEAVHDLAGKHVYGNHDHQVGPLSSLLGSAYRQASHRDQGHQGAPGTSRSGEPQG